MTTTEHDMAVAMATEIGKQVPVKEAYQDAASPAARQVGATLEDVVKCIRLVGFPIQWMAVQQDRFRNFIEKAKEPIPEERRVLPPPQLLGPILEGIRYQVDDDEISEAFRRLLSRAMDKDRAGEAHPAFIGIIGRLSSDEAHILALIAESDALYVQGRVTDDVLATIFDHTFPDGICDKKHLGMYLNNLESCGLISVLTHPVMQATTKQVGRTIGKSAFSHITIRLTAMGQTFVNACLRGP